MCLPLMSKAASLALPLMSVPVYCSYCSQDYVSTPHVQGITAGSTPNVSTVAKAISYKAISYKAISLGYKPRSLDWLHLLD